MAMITEILGTVIVGLIAGLLAKAILPGNKSEPSGWIMTAVLGIVGGLLVGMGGNNGWIPRIFGATIGAVVLILLMRQFGPKSTQV